MEKKESKKMQDIKNQTIKNKKLKASRNSENNKINKDKSLPWWVELLFVQIGLPDKWLIKILNTKRKSTELLKNEKRLVVIFLFVLAALAYFYPVVKYSKTKLNCESIAKNYILENKKLNKLNRKQLRMLSTNFCNGGNEIYEIENLNN